MPGDGERSSGITSITPACGQGFGETGDAGVRRRGVFRSSVHGTEGKPGRADHEMFTLAGRKLVASQLQVNMALVRRKRRKKEEEEAEMTLLSAGALWIPPLAPHACSMPINYLSAFASLHEIFSPVLSEMGGFGGRRAHGATGGYWVMGMVRGEGSLG